MMKYRVPAYYNDFRCIGSACEATCCSGWRIEIDSKSYDRYQKVPGNFGQRLRAGIDHSNRLFYLCKRNCSFLNQVGLCDIYKELGQEGLCATCKNYPRHMEDYGVLREVMLSTACPEAARLILSDPEQGVFLEKSGHGNAREDVDLSLLKALEAVRHTMTTLIKNRTLHINSRLAMVLAFAHDVQRRLDDGAGLPLEALIKRYSADNATERFLIKVRPYECRWEERIIRMNAFLRESAMLEPIVIDWQEQQMNICSRLYHHQSREQYRHYYQLFTEAADKQELLWENLILYFINTYVLGALYDQDVYSKAKLAVFSWLIIREQVFAAYSQSIGQGMEAIGWLPAMLTQAAWRYSREVENLDDNLNTLEHGFRKNGLFSLDSMLTVLLGAPV